MSTITLEYAEEFERQRTAWLHQRFLWYTGALGVFFAVTVIVRALLTFGGAHPFELTMRQSLALLFTANVPQAIIFLAAFFWIRGRTFTRDQLLFYVFWLVVTSGAIAIVASSVAVFIQADGPASAQLMAVASLGTAFIVHVLASLFIPWSVNEAIRPLAVLIVIYALTTLLLARLPLVEAALLIAFSPLIGAPGLFISWLRHSRFRERFHLRMLRGRYGELRRELIDAQRIHEGLLPERILEGPILFDYEYQPMREIGGDFLFAVSDPVDENGHRCMSVVVLDVTGHGVAAALTVNRLYGELERLFAENPSISPGELVRALNRYINLTLTRHNVYATGICIRISTGDDLVAWANAGHPPAFLRSAAGRIDRLDSTAIMLGAVGDTEFDPGEQAIRFGAGDSIILYTDGATEARDREGAMFGIDGVQQVVASRVPAVSLDGCAWSTRLAGAVRSHRADAVADDTLVVEIARPVTQ